MRQFRIYFIILVVACLTQISLAEEEAPKKSPFEKAIDWADKANPFKKSNSRDNEVAGEEPKSEPAPSAKSPPETEPPARTKPAPKSEVAGEVEVQTDPKTTFDPHKNKTHISVGLGNLALQGNSGSVIEKNYEPSSSAQINLGYEQTISESGSFEMNLTFLSVSSKLKNSVNNDMSIMYLAIPLLYKHRLAPVGQYSNFYLKGGVIPLMLLSASVDSCTSALCGADNDLDQWLTESQSISNSFQKYSLLGTVGIGINFLLFKEFLLDSAWLNTDLSYVQGLANVNQGPELGKDVKIGGVQFQLGLAFSF